MPRPGIEPLDLQSNAHLAHVREQAMAKDNFGQVSWIIGGSTLYSGRPQRNARGTM